MVATRPFVTFCTTSAMAPSGTMSPAFGVRTVFVAMKSASGIAVSSGAIERP